MGRRVVRTARVEVRVTRAQRRRCSGFVGGQQDLPARGHNGVPGDGHVVTERVQLGSPGPPAGECHTRLLCGGPLCGSRATRPARRQQTADAAGRGPGVRGEGRTGRPLRTASTRVLPGRLVRDRTVISPPKPMATAWSATPPPWRPGPASSVTRTPTHLRRGRPRQRPDPAPRRDERGSTARPGTGWRWFRRAG